MTELLSLPLRERKRAETWTAIHDAAAAMALEKGPQSVTVEAIAEQAGISARTFFNYFSVKEDAILGLQEPKIEAHAREEFAVADDFLDRVSKLLLTVAQTTFGGDYATSRRFDVLKQYPELMQRRISYITKVEKIVAELVEQRLAESDDWREDMPDVSPAETAQIIVMMGSATMRFAMQRGTPVGAAAQFEALEGASTLFRRILRKVT